MKHRVWSVPLLELLMLTELGTSGSLMMLFLAVNGKRVQTSGKGGGGRGEMGSGSAVPMFRIYELRQPLVGVG